MVHWDKAGGGSTNFGEVGGAVADPGGGKGAMAPAALFKLVI